MQFIDRIPHRSRVAFGIAFLICLGAGAAVGISQPADASTTLAPPSQGGDDYAGPEKCGICHEGIFNLWQDTRHAHAFSSPIFQQNWHEIGDEFECLSCHATGYDPAINTYENEGVTCEACHGPLQSTHPTDPMPIKADAELCATCHDTTTEEWKASMHGQEGVQCQACHDPHAQQPKAEGVTELCSNCHKERGESYTHGTHADAGLECSNCHMFTVPRFGPPIEGLVPTGHTFSVGSQACVGCHQDTVHTRDKILSLSGEVTELTDLDTQALQQQVQENAELISELEAQSDTRLYVGLAQGGIVGLATGAVAAWVVSRGLRVVEVEVEDEETEGREAEVEREDDEENQD
jgi:formate-dependent nitrite reductase cytochrome c552 subunit